MPRTVNRKRYLVCTSTTTHLEPLRVRRQDGELQGRRHDGDEDHAAQTVGGGILACGGVIISFCQGQIVDVGRHQLDLSSCGTLLVSEASSVRGKVDKNE